MNQDKKVQIFHLANESIEPLKEKSEGGTEYYATGYEIIFKMSDIIELGQEELDKFEGGLQLEDLIIYKDSIFSVSMTQNGEYYDEETVCLKEVKKKTETVITYN